MKKFALLILIALAVALVLFSINPDGNTDSETPPAEGATTTSQEAETVSSTATPAEPVDASALRSTVPSWDAATIKERCDAALTQAKTDSETLATLDLDAVNIESLVHRWESSAAKVEDMLGPVYLLAYTHTDGEARDAGQACIVATTKLQTELFQDPRLYERVQKLAVSDVVDQKFKQDLIQQFEDTGVSLPEDKRARAKAIFEEIATLSQTFSKNLRENNEKLSFGPEEQTGLPETYLEKVEKDGDNIRVGFNYPEAYPFLTYAENAAARERMYRGFLNRGGSDNLKLLEQIVALRRELAGLYDLPSYAHYVTRRYMVGNPETVHKFLDEVAGTIREVEKSDIEMLRQEKAAHLKLELDQVNVNPWDKEFYLERLRNARFNVDQEALRSYFPTPQTVDWALGTTGKLYGISFHEQAIETWQEDIRYFDVHDSASGNFIGGLYLDLYPREGKYGHAAAFPIRGSSSLLQRRPVTALVTNFDRKGLTQREVETLLHELGHAVHGVLSSTRYVSQAGTSVERDFVEAPSQMYEEWAQRIQTLQTMRDYCAHCPLLDEDTVNRINAARKLASGLKYGRQHLYASFDMALASESSLPPQKQWAMMEGRTPLGHAEGTQFPGTFAHIAGGYASGYYGYMWSETLAMDFVSVFGDNLMDTQKGAEFRNKVLSRGSEVSAQQMVQDFLGREPSPEAFFKEIQGGE